MRCAAADREATDAAEREHVLPFVYARPERFAIGVAGRRPRPGGTAALHGRHRRRIWPSPGPSRPDCRARSRRPTSRTLEAILADDPGLAEHERGDRPASAPGSGAGPAQRSRGELNGRRADRRSARSVAARRSTSSPRQARTTTANLDQAKRLIDVAAEAGADAVKFQTFAADRIVAETTTRAKYLDDAPAAGQDDVGPVPGARAAARVARRALFEHATAAGLDFLSTPFDLEAVDLLDDLGVKAFKVASYELWHLPLIREVASRGKPIICSTGMADLADVQDAVDTVAATGNEQLILLHCVVNYPPPFARPEPAGDRDAAPGVPRPGRLQRPQLRDHGADRRDGARRGGDREALHARAATCRGRITGSPSSRTSSRRWSGRSATPRTRSATGIKRMAPAEADLYVTARRSLFAARDLAGGHGPRRGRRRRSSGPAPGSRSATCPRSSGGPRDGRSGATSRSPGTCSDGAAVGDRVAAAARMTAVHLVTTAGSGDGGGHLSRALALAEALAARHVDVSLEMLRGQPSPGQAARLERLGVSIRPPDDDALILVDLPDPNEVADRWPRRRLAAFDDRELLRGQAALVIQPSLARWGGSADPDRLLEGYDYAPIRDTLAPARGGTAGRSHAARACSSASGAAIRRMSARGSSPRSRPPDRGRRSRSSGPGTGAGSPRPVHGSRAACASSATRAISIAAWRRRRVVGRRRRHDEVRARPARPAVDPARGRGRSAARRAAVRRDRCRGLPG